MKKHWPIAVIILLLLISTTACGTKNPQTIVSEALSLDVSSGSEAANYDTHSGNGDGTSCIALRFKRDKVLSEIRNDPGWKTFPLDETVQTLVYGIEDETGKYGPYLTDRDEKPLVPEIRNGYYLLIDRQAEREKATETDILHRSSFNFDLGLYDADTDTLYFCRLDT